MSEHLGDHMPNSERAPKIRRLPKDHSLPVIDMGCTSYRRYARSSVDWMQADEYAFDGDHMIIGEVVSVV